MIHKPGSIIQALGLRSRELISLVGGGGKTTLLFRLARELVDSGRRVLATTTTKILEPSSEDSPRILVESKDEKIMEALCHLKDKQGPLTVARERLESNKLGGISSDLVDRLYGSGKIDDLLVEADGAAGRPVKAPRDGEPVIPSETTLVIVLVGVDGMGVVLQEENVFRSEIVSRLTGVPPGGKITDQVLATLVTHPMGLFKGAPTRARVAVFLNKVDIPDGLEKGRRISRRILEQRHPQIERILIGQLKKDPPVIEVIGLSPESEETGDGLRN
jgi:probable selenium-dependent hydroxylase accessory protein YqeC